MERLAAIARFRVHPMLFAALLLVPLLSIIDFCLTLLILQRGGAEMNPLFCGLINHQPWAAYWLKFCLTTAGVTVLAATSDARASRAGIFGLLAVYGSLICYELFLLSLAG